ncbi:uncharacterized protein LOC110447972 isoform X2 [Mizuhopecten yessoensis]|nr:uncharacterized protein LOC110447972 isoform X2 [Mizuhopecten yessoensis]
MPCVIMPGSITSSSSRLGIHGSSSASNSRLGIPICSTASSGLLGMPGSSAASSNHLSMLQNTVQSSSGGVNLGAAQLSLLEHSNVLGVSAIQDNDRNLYICENDADNQMSENFNSIYEKSNQMSRQAFTMRRTRTNIPYSVKCQISKMAEESPRITQGEIAQIFGIDRTTVSKILKKRKMYVDPSSPHSPSKISRSAEHENSHYDLESTLLNWYTGLQEKKASVTMAMVADAAENLADVYGVPLTLIDTQWVSSFCRRHSIICSREDFPKIEYAASKSSTPMQYKQGQFQHRNKRDIDRRMPPSAARGSASETQTSGQNLTQPKPTSRPIPNQSCNKIPRDRSQFPTSGAIEGLNETETMDVTHDDHVSEKVVVKEEPEFEELGPEEALNRDLGTLERFREQQKEIEEANKHKKALLSKTLSERQKKARKEAEKLTHIQKELMILDNLLSADVTVVRNRIEFASRDYMEATRRYDKAEKEFIEAKLDLQKKSELKEQLTEHLYTIIHQNEIRKAKKLSDLMTELDMETKGEQLCIGKLPPLSAFSSMGIAKIASPTSPKSPTSDNVQAVKTDRGTTSEIPVSSSSDNLASTVNSSNSTSADQPRTETNLSNVVVDLSNENSTLNKENSCSPNSSSKDIHDTNSEQSESQGNTQNLAVENSDSIIGEEDLTLNDNTEQPSHSSSADDSSSYNSALSSNLGGDNSSESPKHAGIQDTEGTMPSSWTLDSVNIKEEPVT